MGNTVFMIFLAGAEEHLLIPSCHQGLHGVKLKLMTECKLDLTVVLGQRENDHCYFQNHFNIPNF